MKKILITALGHIQYITEGIGPRPAGSKNEKQTANYIFQKLKSLGYQTVRDPILFAPLPKYNYLTTIGGILLLMGTVFLTKYSVLAIFLPVVGIILPELSRKLFWKRSGTVPSENVFTEIKSDNSIPILILCAHYDSARARALHSRWAKDLLNEQAFLFQRISMAASFVGILYALGFTIPFVLLNSIATIGGSFALFMIFSEIKNQIFHSDVYSPGANDNASGVGVLLSLAEYYSSKKLTNVNLQFLFTGAEETGLHGARGFVDKLDQQKINNIFVLNLDMVGAGKEMRFVSHDGVVFPAKTNSRMNRILQKIDPKIRAKKYRHISGDHYPFVVAGVAATAVQFTGSSEAYLGYHSIDDTLNIIDKNSIEKTINIIIKFIDEFIK